MFEVTYEDYALNYLTSLSTIISLVLLIVPILYAIVIKVLPLLNSSIACCMRYSFSGSMLPVTSSKIIIGAPFKITLAMAILCFSYCRSDNGWSYFYPVKFIFSKISSACASSTWIFSNCSSCSKFSINNCVFASWETM